MDLNNVYFFISTIEGWKHLLKDDQYKDIIINSLKYLSDKELGKSVCFCDHAQPYTFDLGNAWNKR